MKKKILIMALSLGVLSYAQKTFVTGNLPVKVEERTLFYNGGGFEVSSADALVWNQGNIQVATGDFKVVNNGDKDNFFLDWQEKGIGVDGINTDLGYGQLIINEAVSVDGTSKIRIEREVPGDNIIDNVQIGFPFSTADTPNTIINHPTNTGYIFTNSGNRLLHPLYKWNNSLMRWDRKNKDGGVNNWEYYIIRNAGGMVDYNPSAAPAVRTHIGTPANVAVIRSFYDHSSLPDFTSVGSVNYYNEVYKSYIDEYFDNHPDVVAQGNMGWGKNQYQYGNPYTSNIDLSYIGLDEDALGAYYDENGNGSEDAGEALNDNNNIASLIGVYKEAEGNEVNPVYGYEANEYTPVVATAAADGSFQAGDYSAVLVKPMEAFVIKTSTHGESINFNDGLKTFAYNAKAEDIALPSGATSNSYRSADNSAYGNEYYQLRLNLNNTTNFINKTYVVANQNLINGLGGRLESNLNDDFTTGIYTRQELAVGEGVDATAPLKYYINQVNTDYLGIPIPLYMENLENGGSYSIDFDLCLGISNLPEEQLSYENPEAKYFFHDIYNDTYFEIYNNSTYDFTKIDGDGASEGNRFELFYGEMGEVLGVEDMETLASTTVVYQRDDSNFIKFDKNWNEANIYVYTAVGQIVYMKEKISTENDFLLPLNDANITTYIVKIENPDTGESVSKKVIK